MQYFKAAILRLGRFLPTKPYVYLFYWARTGRRLSLKDPKGFAEKIQWLKINGDLERFAPYADKYLTRGYVEKTIGKEHLIPLIGAWDSFDEIPFDKLPKRFVLKISNGCEYNYICKDKSALDMTALKAKIQGWQREDFYRLEREAQYKTPSRIVGERYLEDASGALTDYKIHCTKGKARYVQIDVDRFIDHKSETRDLKWRKVPFGPDLNFSTVENPMPRPENLDEMVRLAEKLAAPFPYVRVDLYVVGNKIYFGELTFTPGSGTVILQPAEGEITFGKLIDLKAYARPLAV